MGISFGAGWRRHAAAPDGTAAAGDGRQEGLAALLAECELLHALAEDAGVHLDHSAGSLDALDQLTPRWRDDTERMSWLGNDAGLYLGTVIVRTVPGAGWELLSDGSPVVRLASGRRIDTVAAGLAWAESGTPELGQIHAESAEGTA